jgi:hypothetical protein
MRVIETKWLFWADGFTINSNLIVIRPGIINKESLIAHEKVHCEQMLKVGAVYFWFKYLICSDFRFRVEAEAYATSVKVKTGSNDIVELSNCANNYAYYLSKHYYLGISADKCKAEIMKYLI